MEKVLNISEEQRIAVELEVEQLKDTVAAAEEEVRTTKEESAAVFLASEADGRSLAEDLKVEREQKAQLELRVAALYQELKKEVELRVTAEETASVDGQISKERDNWKVKATKFEHEVNMFKAQTEQLQKQLEQDKAYHKKLFLIEEAKKNWS